MSQKTLAEKTKQKESRAKPLTTEQLELLYNLYYKKNLTFGRDKLFKYLQLNHSDENISRRTVSNWLAKQEVHSVHRRAKSQKDLRATVSKKLLKTISGNTNRSR